MQALTCVDKVKEIRIEIEAYATAGWQVEGSLGSFNQDSDSGTLTANVLAKLVNAALADPWPHSRTRAIRRQPLIPKYGDISWHTIMIC